MQLVIWMVLIDDNDDNVLFIFFYYKYDSVMDKNCVKYLCVSTSTICEHSTDL